MNWRRWQYLVPSIRRRIELDVREELEELARMGKPGELGNLTLAAEDARAAWGWMWLSDLVSDVRYGFRSLWSQPGLLGACVLTLALGLGANTAIFNMMNATVLRPVSLPDAGRLVLIWKTFGPPPNNENIIAAPDFWDFRDQAHCFETVAIFDSGGRGYNLSDSGAEPEQVSGVRVSAGFFSVLGVAPLLGRSFLPEEEFQGRDHETILSYSLWKGRYGGDPAIVGRTIKIDGEGFTVVGVMPRDFNGQFWSGPRQLWVPVGYTKADYSRGNNSFVALARLNPGVTLAQGRLEVAAIGARIARQFPVEDASGSATIESLNEFGLSGLRHTLATVLLIAGFVLLIGCVNVANLMLARGASRQRELAIRRALGAAAWRISRQLLTESALISGMGGMVGVVLALGANRLLFSKFGDYLQLPMRHLDSISLDLPVLLFALLLSGITGISFGLAPALSALRVNVNEPLKAGGRGSTGGEGGRLRHALVALEVALALAVLAGAGLLIKSAARLLGVDPGLKPENVLTMFVSVPQQETYVGPPGLPNFCRDLEENIGAIPGVISSSAVGHLPFEGNAGRGFQIEGRPPAAPADIPGANYSVACPGYFRTMGIPILKGREFTERDTLNAPGVIVINETMARKFWPKEDPVGQAIRFEGSSGPRLTIVGVVGDVHYQGLDTPVANQFMRPYTQAGWPIMNIVVHTRSTPLAFAPVVKKAVRAFLPDRPVSRVDTMANVVRNSVGPRRLPMLLLVSFSLVALLLAAVGIMGVVSYAVTQRALEIGIRIAVGARRQDVLGMVLHSSMKWVSIGIALGIVGSIGVARVLGSLLYGVSATDLTVLVTVTLVLAGVALLASLIPAFRAANLDPIRTLRHE